MMNGFLRKHFSLMLALRYLNPLRTFFSVISLICLMGVSLGVMVLIVVLSVMSGLQRDIKERFLAYAPHVTVQYTPGTGEIMPLENWREVVEILGKDKRIESVYPQIEDYVLVDAGGAQKPSGFRAIDTENEYQMSQLSPMIVDGSFDMGMGEVAVVSTSMATSMRLNVGDVLRVYAKRNYENVIRAYQQSESSLKKKEGQMLGVVSGLWNKAKIEGDKEIIEKQALEAVATVLDGWLQRPNLRDSETNSLIAIMTLFEESKEEGDTVVFAKGSKAKYLEHINEIVNLDTDKEDLAAFRNVKDLVLPRDLTVVGVYQSSRHLASPDIFVPLNIGQELLGMEDAAQGIAIKAVDPHDLGPVEAAVSGMLPKLNEDEGEQWIVRNWMENPSVASWVSLMQQERVMISFVLFFITLVAAFCIMAVMFAMSIQRRKEIAVMRALGATPMQVIFVFLWQGIVIGLLGSSLGIGLGLLVLKYRVQIREFLQSLNFDPFPVNFHGVQIPSYIQASEVAFVAVLAFVMVVLVSIIPAVLTARQDPAKSLRSL